MSEQQVSEATTAAEEPAVDVIEVVIVEEPMASVEVVTIEEPMASAAVAIVEEPMASTAVDNASDDGSSGTVRMLSVGQQVKGTIKRVTEFGAFVDIGVGRDGLVHISELSSKRVGKVSDVLQEGQEVMLWIKKLDRDRNRISLTLIEPGQRTIRDLQKGEVVEGTVTRILPYGAFVDIGVGRDALLHVREMGEGFIAKPEDVVQVGQLVETRIIEIARRRSRVDLSMKGLRPEPEVEQQPTRSSSSNSSGSSHAPAPEPEPEIELPDDFANLEVLSPMQLAFQRAQEKSGVVLTPAKPAKANRREQEKKNRAIQEEIIARTLSTSSTGKK